MKKKFSKIKLLFIGPYIPSKNLATWPAVSPAANKWQKFFLNSLSKLNVDLEYIYYRPSSLYPKGKLLPFLEKVQLDINYKTSQIKYLNIPFFKNYTLQISLLNKLKKIINHSSKNQIKFIISYNTPAFTKKIFLDPIISENYIKINLLADDKTIAGSDASVFLSFYEFLKSNEKNKIHIDGGIYPIIKKNLLQKKKINKFIFFYSGSLLRYIGINILIKALDLIKEKNFELWISGPGAGKSKLLKTAAEKDERIKILGFLNNEKLMNAYNQADIFINPRNTALEENVRNFPSKLFDYLGWQKKIISSWTPGLSPDYRKVLHIVKNTSESLASAMKFYLKKNDNKNKLSNEFLKKKSWDTQAKKFVYFLRRLLIENKSNKCNIIFTWEDLPAYGYHLLKFLYLKLKKNKYINLRIISNPGIHQKNYLENSLFYKKIIWINKTAKYKWKDLGLKIPNIYFQAGWKIKSFFYLGRFVNKQSIKIICTDNSIQKRDIKQTIGSYFFKFFYKKHFSSSFVPGISGKNLMIKFGFKVNEIFTNSYAALENIYKNKTPILNRKKQFIFVGQLIKRKNVEKLVNAFINANSNHNAWKLIIVGKGELTFSKNQLGDNIKIIQSLPPRELNKLYNQSRFLILPSIRDHWPLVVNEACLAGCFLVLSDTIGSIKDLANQKNSLIFNPFNNYSIQKTIEDAMKLNNKELMIGSKESLRLARHFNYKRTYNSIKKIINNYLIKNSFSNAKLK
jgi:glycosyltransferase involved in cell wall biosynthesis